MLKLMKSLRYANAPSLHFVCKCATIAQAYDSDKAKPHGNSAIKKYFEAHGLTNLLVQTPEKYCKRASHLEFGTSVDPKIAKKIAFAICSRLNDSFIIESDPGFGFMSEIFVSEFPRVTFCERNEMFRSKLENKLQKMGKTSRIFDFNYQTLTAIILNSEETLLPQEVTDFFQYISDEMKSNDYKKICWIFPVLNHRVVRRICGVQLSDYVYKELGEMEYYILLPSMNYEALTSFPYQNIRRFGKTAVLFQTAFDHEILLRNIPRKMYLPWPSIHESVDEELILLRLTPKVDVSTFFKEPLMSQSFYKFLSIGLRKRKRVIPVLEKFVNDCGPVFILDHNLTVYTEFLELTPQKLLSVFLSFSNLPEFSHSTFVEMESSEFSDQNEKEKNLMDDDSVEEELDECDDEDDDEVDDERDEKFDETLEDSVTREFEQPH